ncbi:MAG TPA: cyclic nucleotide-binding domain-containing protein [Terriglobales bacterium]|nr:cyclic nucleotide-binding domain-containing protein [Terriglobales bacterium]
MCAVQSELQDLLAAGTRKRFRPSAILFVQGDKPSGVYLLCSGKIRLFIRNPVTGVITFDRTVEPGSILGLPAVFGDKTYSMSAEVLEEAEMAFIPSRRFLELMQTNGQLCMRCLQLLSDEVRIARSAIGGD